MQTISVPKETKFVEFQLDLDDDGKNDVWVELQFIECTHDNRWGIVAILPGGQIIGKTNTKPDEPWITFNFRLKDKIFTFEVISDPEDAYKMIILR